MQTKSLWNHYARAITFPTLTSDLQVDVAVIGGGVCGVSVAHALSKQGLKVALIEALKVGGGTTAHSTGNLYATVDKNLKKLRSKYDLSKIRTLVSARQSAIDEIEKNISDYGIDCDFVRGPWTFYADSEEAGEKINDDFEVALEVGLPVKMIEMEQPYKARRAMQMLGQARFNSMLYVQGLAEKINSSHCQIFENTAVHSISHDGGVHKLTTESGKVVRAKYLVHATHIPKGVKVIQSYLGPYREYGIACKVTDPKFEGTYWGYHGEEENFISSRFYERNGEKYLIVVGQPHKVGQNSENNKCIEFLCDFARKYFDVESIPFKWGGQHYRPADFLPYIGREKENSSVFIATGFSTDGLIYGSMAGEIISALIQNKEDESTELFKPYRTDPIKSFSNLVKENLDVAVQYLKDIPHNVDVSKFSEVKNGEGQLVEHEGQKIAAYRDDTGKLTTCSAICTHMKCVVNWNPSEKSWDCPCHGSRFEATGKLIEGPALHNLHSVNVKEQ